ncbi:hypothetical protein RRG08_013026 [Elysia crispata]|uniref:Major facilitator superfamily (MFS) profile domain-containing protein n=1 Tax=Elysia crispata TaxID=231223 RepID=A0AAE1DQP2_9GAST|nr:hypothetical protein RRG08_013026 [Elysia crispata]
MRFDEIVAQLGDFGPYQKRLYFLMCWSFAIVSVQILAGVFIQATPKHRCALPGLLNDTYISQGPWHDELVNASIPWDSDEEMFDQCMLRRAPDGLDNDTASCDKWVYSKHPFKSTFVTDADLVCSEKSLVTYASMILMCGMLFGSLVLGVLSDIIGRKKVLVISTFGQLCSALSVAWAESYYVYAALRFFVSFFSVGLILTSFVMGMELVGAKKRRYAGVVVHLFWCLGLFIETGLAYGIRDWKYLQITITAPVSFILLLYIAMLPESPRWLLQRGKTEEAARILQSVANKNGVKLTEKFKSLEDVEIEGDKESIWQMFTHRVLLTRSLIVFFNWFVASMVYYGLSLNVGDLSGNIYLNFFLSAVVELVSYLCLLALLDRLGRKFWQCFSMILGGVACIATMFPVMYGGEDIQWVTVALSLVGKFGGSAGFVVIYLYTAEIFPTVMRNSGMGLCSLCARIGGILAPYIGDLNVIVDGDLGIALPLLIFGSLSVTAGLLVIFLPETSHKVLPDTVEDAKNFGLSYGSLTKNNTLSSSSVGKAQDQDNLAFSLDDSK